MSDKSSSPSQPASKQNGSRVMYLPTYYTRSNQRTRSSYVRTYVSTDSGPNCAAAKYDDEDDDGDVVLVHAAT